MKAQEFSIQDLCDQTGLPRRTIHFYIQQQILPPPQGSGLAARYGSEHLLRLQVIPILRSQGLRLDGIRTHFHNSSTSELEDLLAGSDQKIIEQPLHSLSPERNQGTPCLSYTLPGGIILLAPANLPANLRVRLLQLLQTADSLFS